MIDNITIIKNKISITDILSLYNIKANKANFINCPFHNEKTPSCKIYTKTNTFKCFSCNVSGDIIKFVQLMENTDFNGAIKYIDNAFRLGLSKPLTEEEKKEWGRKLKQKEKERFKALEMAKFERKLLDDIIAEIRINEALIAQRKPYNANKLERYAYTEDCDKYLTALAKKYRLEKLIDWLLAFFWNTSEIYNEELIVYTYTLKRTTDVLFEFAKSKPKRNFDIFRRLKYIPYVDLTSIEYGEFTKKLAEMLEV